ncbi:hypothetical protein LptCag_1717 [Leptospirillum ferriphilum]|uniref:Uncharacterized protein n=2 Tax=Leptospirillum ferriphilum TaxID=178606 RepID=A0A094W588_9BACT|nr:hypothetical protein LFML04_1731 [Leptospirillum ferriphilum ML-04]KGA92573.1 hypothetical protein LptCag_1717 [Leptospirillum ferriphilum]
MTGNLHLISCLLPKGDLRRGLVISYIGIRYNSRPTVRNTTCRV